MVSVNPAPEHALMWNSGAFKFTLNDAARSSKRAPEVHSAIEVAAAINAGEFDRAVGYLGWILREADISSLAAQAGIDYEHFDELLQRVTSDEALLPLTEEQRTVAKMLYAVRVLGLDSEVHPSERAIRVLSRFKDAFSQRPVSETRRYNPVAAAASLLAAQGSECEHAQPTGVWVLEEAYVRKIPAVLVTTNHTLGSDSIFLVAESLAQKQVLNGRVDSSDLWLSCNDPDATIFWESRKDTPEVWIKAFKRLATLGLAPGNHILIVEDCRSGSSHPDDPEQVRAPIRQAFAACEELKDYTLAWEVDTNSGLTTLEQGQIAGVVSDLFMPWVTGSHSKSAGDRIVKDILSPYLSSETVEHLLTTFRDIEGQVGQVVREEFEKLIVHL
jgi:hypothetical protein